MSTLRGWSLMSILILPLPLAAEIHQWTDAQGGHHFGDKPSERFNSQPLNIDVPQPSTVSLIDKSTVQPLNNHDIANQRLLELIEQQDLAEKKALTESNQVKQQRCIEGRKRISVLEQPMPIYRDKIVSYVHIHL